ncbi:MAG: hypothetical protein V7K48_11120 [Nostoc sp.]|uniref:hypothetical protein n=1 Tax=Nostoc sp. TaxID=1180 RepID=UPI002FFB21D8
MLLKGVYLTGFFKSDAYGGKLRTTHLKNVVGTQQFVVRYRLFNFIIPPLNVIVQA